tara:strand:- start:340 stop:798 length:459 start_codon:yes stop_codon:yes gene_type:complete
MGVYKSLTKDFSSDVAWLRKELIKKVLDTCDYLESYETFNFFTADVPGEMISEETVNEYLELVYRIKSALPTSTTEDIKGDILSEIILRESEWADGWAKYSNHKKLEEDVLTAASEYAAKYTEHNRLMKARQRAEEDFAEYVARMNAKYADC